MDHTTWVEVNTSALTDNFQSALRHFATPICAIVKANGYGHGLAGSAKIFAKAGAVMVGVTRPDEAAALQREGVGAPILVLTPVPDHREAASNGWRVTVASADEIRELPSEARVHLKVDTGMGRLGVRPGEVIDAARAISERATLEAVWTHFASVGDARGTLQLRRFLGIRDAVKAAGIECQFHSANSAATLAYSDARLDMVRLGTLLYGENLGGLDAPFPLQDGFAWFARVASVREIGPGESVGYGGEWRAKEPTRIATLPVGYSDGLTVQPLSRSETVGEAIRIAGGITLLALGRRPSQRIVHFGDKPAPIIGRIAMQEISVSLKGLPEIEVGSVAKLPARRLLVNPAIERVYN